jgi:hypothetical protein
MAAWRMAMRGRIHPADQSWLDPPIEMWPYCRGRGIAAITYDPVQDDDFDRYSQEYPPKGWAHLGSIQKTSLKRFVYEMQERDVIYVRESPKIVGKGIVVGEYKFDLEPLVPNALGVRWRHQRRVEWLDFQEVAITIGKQHAMTLVPLTPDDVARIERTQSRPAP